MDDFGLGISISNCVYCLAIREFHYIKDRSQDNREFVLCHLEDLRRKNLMSSAHSESYIIQRDWLTVFARNKTATICRPLLTFCMSATIPFSPNYQRTVPYGRMY